MGCANTTELLGRLEKKSSDSPEDKWFYTSVREVLDRAPDLTTISAALFCAKLIDNRVETFKKSPSHANAMMVGNAMSAYTAVMQHM